MTADNYFYTVTIMVTVGVGSTTYTAGYSKHHQQHCALSVVDHHLPHQQHHHHHHHHHPAAASVTWGGVTSWGGVGHTSMGFKPELLSFGDFARPGYLI